MPEKLVWLCQQNFLLQRPCRIKETRQGEGIKHIDGFGEEGARGWAAGGKVNLGWRSESNFHLSPPTWPFDETCSEICRGTRPTCDSSFLSFDELLDVRDFPDSRDLRKHPNTFRTALVNRRAELPLNGRWLDDGVFVICSKGRHGGKLFSARFTPFLEMISNF